MATEVYTTEIVRLLDETEVELRPLPISKLRKFTRMWTDHIRAIQVKLSEQKDKELDEQDFTEADLTDAQFDVFIKMCALGLESQLKKADQTDKKFLDYLEDVLDEKTIYRILDLTGGLKLGEDAPNLQAPVMNLGAGTN